MPTEYFFNVLFTQYFDFLGVATRKQYWLFFLYFFIIFAILYAFVPEKIIAIFEMLMIIPDIAITVRRIRDAGLSGWWIFIGFVPGIGGLVLLYFTLVPTDYFGFANREVKF